LPERWDYALNAEVIKKFRQAMLLSQKNLSECGPNFAKLEIVLNGKDVSLILLRAVTLKDFFHSKRKITV